jgi:hypothetical protein
MAGLKTLAKELQSKGRYGDTVLAHINPQEAGILKALGGSGTINPDTGLPEYFIKKITQPFVQATKAVQNIPGIKQVSDVSTKAFRPIDQALVGLDKTVGKAIPGGWETVGQVALSAMGVPTSLQVAYGAARGGGMLRPGSSLKKVNLQGALIGGATAYATAELGDYMRGASDAAADASSQSLNEAVKQSTFDPKTLVDTGMIESTDKAALNALSKGIEEGAGKGLMVAPPPSISSELMSGNFGNVASRGLTSLENLGTSAVEGVKNLGSSALDFGNKAITPSTYTEGIPNLLEKGYENAGETFSGAKNLLGAGDMTRGEAIKLAAKTGIDPIKMTGLGIYGTASLAGMEEQRKYLEEAKRANAISQAEYDTALGEINRQRDYAADVVSRNQFNPNPNRDVSIGDTFYGRTGGDENFYARTLDPTSSLYAMGGQVDDELGGDYSAMGMDQGNLQKGLFGLGYAAGGMPRFLSGGGDGMSDSIKATINDNQPARLADGEFVIPADVVSHLGNGSSKAGAKQLYSMMDKVRKARTGNPKQGKQINPRKYMPA